MLGIVTQWEESYREAKAERGVTIQGGRARCVPQAHFSFSVFLYHRTVQALFHNILHGPREI